MFGLRARLAALVVALVAVVAPPAQAASGIGALRICTTCAANAGDLARYDYAILNAWEAWRVPSLKAADPTLRLLVYKNASMTVDYAVTDGRDNAYLPAGIGYVAAAQKHPEWFLTDTSGRRIEASDYPGVWLMDVGNPAYQEAWLAAVGAEARARGWDGVMLDDVNTSPRWHVGDRVIAAYPTDAAYSAAVRSFLARVGPALQSQGVAVVPNISTAWPDGPAVWRDWLRFTSGGLQEYWTKWGRSTTEQFSGADWAYRQQFLAITQDAGKLYLGVTYAPAEDVRSMAYARASFLLDWDGGPSALVFEPDGGADPFAPEWTVQVGTPRGPRFAVGGAWRRNFTGGTVVVNPGPRSTTVGLGADYLRADGSRVRTVRLASATGIVLRAAAPRTAKLRQPASRR